MGHVVVPVDPVKIGRTGRSESEEDPFKWGNRGGSACPKLDASTGEDHRGER